MCSYGKMEAHTPQFQLTSVGHERQPSLVLCYANLFILVLNGILN